MPTKLKLTVEETEAAREAIKAFDRYLKVSDDVSHDGGMNPDRLAEVATSILLEAELNGAKTLREDRQHVTGKSSYDSAEVKAIDVANAENGGKSAVTLYACVDVSRTDVVDAEGKSTLHGDRRTRWPSTYSIWRESGNSPWLVGDLKQDESAC
ncbi:hypothetical protein LWF01_05160 [Saxibacter everestensis]|uniref:Tim44-like domain-containing protein n=1 Tax=Saxibacter everestensis TaxID=2909229 RepID=A0ABY8QVW3_9MICO|nr:hypothetical protein LWF01_05160 [Brevibacteriaceae bacterium ZFBP1038]